MDQKIKIDDLSLLKCLGKGSYGEVYLTTKAGKQGFFATKKMDRKFADQPNNAKYLQNEIQILRRLNHVNIVKLEDIKVTKNHYYLVMEYCNGGSLSDCLKKYQQKYGVPFSEEIVQYLMKQIISAIKYIHYNNIIHRDLKLDNILVSFMSDYDKANLNMMKACVKIIDFGFARYTSASDLCTTTLGSPINMDPNILKKMNEKKMGINTGTMAYNQKADIWSLGTLCYEMLIGKSAFNSKSMQELINKVESGSYSIPTHLSKQVISFLNGMLQYNAEKRLSANELSRHHFLTKSVREFEPIDVRKVSNKINRNNDLNINIKKNATIWSIFNEEDENKLINIPTADFLVPISEEEEYNVPSNFNSNNNNYYSVPQNNIQINSIGQNSNQGYGVGYNGISEYSANNNSNVGYGVSNYPSQQFQQPQMTFNAQNAYPFGLPESMPNIGYAPPEPGQNNNLYGGKQEPILRIPSFGVPSPGENYSPEGGYNFNNGIYRANSNQF